MKGIRSGGMDGKRKGSPSNNHPEIKRLNLGIQGTNNTTTNNNKNHPLLKRVGWSVMIIDDPKTRFDSLNDLHHLFLDFGCLVHACREPSQALSLLKKENKYIDFVICNIHMKGMDKATLFELVGLKDVLVIMMSSYMDMGLVTQGMDHGASSFILRPQTFDDIENLSSFVLKRKKYTSKFPWKLHHMFDQVVSQLGGLDEATPEKILKLMNAENIIPIEVIEEHLRGCRLIERLTQLRDTEKEPAHFKAPTSSGCRIRPEDLLRYVSSSKERTHPFQLRGTEKEPARFKAPTSSGCRFLLEDLRRYVSSSRERTPPFQLRGTEKEPTRFKAPTSSGRRIRPEDLRRYIYASATGV